MTNARARIILAATWLSCAGATSAQSAGALRYPEARRDEQRDLYHGAEVADPYRWLERTDSPETKRWVDEENSLTERYLSAIPERATLRERLTQLWNYPRWGVPIRRGSTYFYFQNSGLQNQSVLFVQRGLTGKPSPVLDPNTLSSDGTVALSALDIAHNARYVAYALSTAGSDWQRIAVRDVESGKDLSDSLLWVKFSGIAWTRDGRGFFYSRYDPPQSGQELVATNRNQKLCYHRLGDPQGRDRVIYERSDHPDWLFDAAVTEDGHYVVIRISQGTDPRTRLYAIDLSDPNHPVLENPVVRLLDDFDAEYELIDNVGSIFLIRTNLSAPRGRIIAVDVNSPTRRFWRTLVPEGPDALQEVTRVGKRLVARYLHDAQSRIRIFAPDGSAAGQVTLPDIGTVTGLEGHPDSDEMFFGFTSYLLPTSIYRADVRDGSWQVFKSPEVALDTARYETRQVFFRGKDGTRIPMFVTAKKGLVLNGTNPTYLYGYGGFDISLTPEYAAARIAWLEQGGVFAVANLRGGGEYGEDWHQAGMLSTKQTVFDDFIAAAEYLVSEKYTSSRQLVIQGASNGGLLVGAVMTQRPEICAVALPAVGVMDMLRFQKFTIGWAWVPEYGSSDDSTQFATLLRYSPLHNIRRGTRYPATLVTTSDHDDRVVPGHSYKFAAALQAAQAGDAPVLIRIETRAGHGAGKPTTKLIDEAADELAFVMRNLGMSTAASSP